ncbi:M3 family oligoendopeptidase [Ligilactobacillus salivarius]|uniref:M3 family oligoendopeptidase n=1 Tax=Ligilactobacillus salivarius TaxID=1624 RepID=UPI00136CD029|nr:M3 family oligoendopeptidase [Ligilactobacillus salivarius]MYZ03522.1 oligoendopeptidase F family protein [Ligilactobacillus salivarius]MYZ72641.1 oligoendopeptidase F family protein [Ligilactobacillus salivarius]MYZ78063.1 oligoendopeptidase F family protein [Ligilactobacillus salivarius]
MALPKRSEVPVNETWDLTAIYPGKKAWKADMVAVRELVTQFQNNYRSKLTEAKIIIAALHDLETIYQKLSWIEHYAFLPQTTDMTNPEYNQMLVENDNLQAAITADLSFFKTEVLTNPVSLLDQVAEIEPQFAPVVRHWKVEKPHQLSPEVEKTLATLSPTLNSSERTYTTARAADWDMEDFEVDGKTYPMSFVLYENTYQYHPNPEVRHKAHQIFSDTLRKHKNTVAANYYTQVSKEKKLADLRGYDSVFDYLLSDQEVSRETFDRQIDVIIDELGPVMQKYVKLLQKERGLDKMLYSDLQIDLDPEFAPKADLESATGYISEAVSVLGEDYKNAILKAFPERWVDFPANAGKESGGFETTPYGLHPYILMSWTGVLPDVYTLIHELLLTHSLEQKSDDPRMKRFAYTTMLTNTYFHNFITHLLEAAFQREVYTLVENGQTFDGDKLTQIKMDVQKRFWGDAVDIDENAGLTWMRQSHYYMGLYSYTYSAGLTIATQSYLKVLEEGQPAVDRWLEYISLGDQKTPMDAAKVAGVDVTTAEPLHNTIKFLNDTVDKVIALTEELNQ